MFKGNNTLTLNEATMIEAVSEYLAKRAATGFAPVVKSVKPNSSSNPVITFEVFVIERVDADQKKVDAGR